MRTKRATQAIIASLLLLGAAGTSFCCIDYNRQKPRTRLQALHFAITQICFSRDDSYLKVGGAEELAIIDVSAWQLLRVYRDWGIVIAIAADSDLVATMKLKAPISGSQWSIRIQRYPAGETVANFDHPGDVHCAAFGQQRLLATGSGLMKSTEEFEPGSVYLWDVDSGKLKLVLRGHKAPVFCCSFSPSGGTLATAGFDGEVKVWDPNSGELRATVSSDKQKILCLAFSCDGKVLAMKSHSLIRLWDLENARELLVMNWNEPVDNWSNSIAFHPKGDMFAAANKFDGTITLFDLKTGQRRMTLRKKGQGEVHGIAFSVNGGTLAAGVSIGEIEVWDVP